VDYQSDLNATRHSSRDDPIRRLRAEKIEPITYSPADAATALGVSRDFFDEHVRPELSVIRRGRKVLIGRRELEQWVERSSARTLDGPSW
jgi:excisionase family DNA binding protein